MLFLMPLRSEFLASMTMVAFAFRESTGFAAGERYSSGTERRSSKPALKEVLWFLHDSVKRLRDVALP